jgi:2'-5' RNA ligase
MEQRIFIAIPWDDNLRANIGRHLSKYQKARRPGRRWLPDKYWHITVLQPQPWGEQTIQKAIDILKDSLAVHRFILRTGQIIPAPPNQPPRMVWCRFQMHNQFFLLQKQIFKILGDHGIGFSHKQRTREIIHTTLARCQPGTLIEFNSITCGYQLAVDCVEIWRSKLCKSGAEYETLGRISLK